LTLTVFALRHMLVLAVLAGTAWSAGSLVMGPHARRHGDPVPWPMTIAIGLAILAQALLLLGLLGWLMAPAVAAMAVGINVAALGEWRRLMAVRSRAVAAMRTETVLTSAAVAAIACPPFLLALYPPLGFDQTMYHLPYARAFAAAGSLPFLPALRYPAFPPLAEVLNAAVLLFADDVATQMAGWLVLVTCAGLVFVWARERSSAAGGWLSAAILWGSPIAVYLGATGYVDPMLGLFGLASLYAAERARRRMDMAWLVAAGALAGSAAGVKYLGLFFVPAAAILVMQSGARLSTGRALAWYASAATVALAPAYGRLIAMTGNPVFPFYPGIFGSNAWDAPAYLGRQGAERLAAVATYLWDMTFRRHAAGGLPFWSPAFAFGVPVAVLGAWRDRTLRRLLLLAVAYLLLAPVHSHYFFGIAPVWCVIIGAAAWRLPGPPSIRQPVLLATALVVALGGAAYTMYRVHKLGLPPATPDGRERLLARELPLFPAISYLNRTAGPVVVYGVNAERMVDYAAGTLLGDHGGPASYTRVADRARAMDSIASALDEIEASYLLVPSASPWWTGQAAVDPRLERVYADEDAVVYRVAPGAL
jgi:hypothetical protein